MLDEVIEAPAGEAYGLRFRVFAGGDTIGQSVVRTVTIDDGDLILTGAGDAPAVGDMILFGRASVETRPMLVTGIEMAEDMACLIRMVDAAPQIDDELDAMAPPPWTGRVGWIPATNSAPPPAPRFTSISTGKAAEIDVWGDLYGADADNTVSFTLLPGTGAVQTTGYRISHRLQGATVWSSIDLPVADGGGSITSYAAGDTVQFKAEGLGLGGQTGPDTPIMTVTIGSGDAAIPGPIEVDGVTVTVLPGGVRIAVDVLDAATTRLQLYRSTAATLNRATDTSGAAVSAEAGRTTILQAGDMTRRNLVADPGMDNAASWSAGPGWSVSGGVATHTPGGGGYSLGGNVGLVSGRSYRVAYDLTISAGNVRARFNGGSIANGTMRTSSGRWTETLIANNQSRIEFLARSAASAAIDNVLVYQPTASCLPAGTHYFWIEPINADGSAGPLIGPFSAIIE